LSSTRPSTSHIYTLSLHDALPISGLEPEQPLALLAPPGHDAALEESRVPADVGLGRPRQVELGHRRPARVDVPGEPDPAAAAVRSEEHTSELQSPDHLVCRLLLEK